MFRNGRNKILNYKIVAALELTEAKTAASYNVGAALFYDHEMAKFI